MWTQDTSFGSSIDVNIHLQITIRKTKHSMIDITIIPATRSQHRSNFSIKSSSWRNQLLLERDKEQCITYGAT